jgi:hypothetical protein
MFNAAKFNIFNSSVKAADSFSPFINFHSFRPSSSGVAPMFSKVFNSRFFANGSLEPTLNMKYSEFTSQLGTFIGKLRFRTGNSEALPLFELLHKGLLSSIESKPSLCTHMFGVRLV